MKIYLVRHGETDANKIHALIGQVENINLNNNGIKQAEELRDKLKNITFDACFASPLSRAMTTAKIVVDDKVEVIEDARIMERYLGELEGKDKELYDVAKYNDFELNTNENNVERIQDLFTRCNNFLNYLKENFDTNSTILVVSHYGCIRVMYHILSNTDTKDLSNDIYIKNCYCECFEM